MFKYKAFGFNILSDFYLPQVLPCEEENTDIRIQRANFTEEEVSLEEDCYSEEESRFAVEDVARFRITNGNLIEVSPIIEDNSLLPLFILGSCMGAILHQRGDFPLHGSCVTDGNQTILITGESGAGKSTLASVFLEHGWKLLTDDVAVIKEPETDAWVQPSYPSQKLWEDVLGNSLGEREDVHSFYQRNGKNKFGIDIREKFLAEPRRLTMVIKLIATDRPASLEQVNGFAKVDQLMRNTYRPFMIMPQNLERHFQRCVTLGQRIPMLLANRNVNDQNREALYEMITGEGNDKSGEKLDTDGKGNDSSGEKLNMNGEGNNSFMEKMDMNGKTRLKRKENIITADMQGSAVTMDMTTGQYYDLGETGGAIWNFLKEEMTYDALLDNITKEYDISKEECEPDVNKFIVKLMKDGLVLASED